jgi:hypothetical protein
MQGLRRRLAVALVCGPLAAVAAPVLAARPSQLEFSALLVGDAVRFRYELQDRDDVRYRIQFRVPRQAIAQARRGFRAFNPQDLRREAEQERRRQLAEAVEGLRRSYPGADIELKADGSIAWRVGLEQDFQQRQSTLYDRLLADELAQIRADFPKAEITGSGNGAFQVRAPSQAMIDAIRKRFDAAQAGANDALARSTEEEKSRVERRSGGIGEDLRDEIERIDQHMQDFQAAYFQERSYKVQGDGYVRPDYARIARESVGGLAPVGAAMASWTRGLARRDVLTRLLLFVQTIPYDRLEDRSTDAGFLPPLVLLAENRGDCDSKSVAFAALAHLLYPDLAVSLVLVPRHAFLALGLQAAGDRTLRYAGRTWVLAEPVGPGVQPLGHVGKESEVGLRHIESVIPLFP